ncbi:acyltransferase [Vibrio parahaemolyticus]|nr:acyltransferase [Vibrio parahaemolyticus]
MKNFVRYFFMGFWNHFFCYLPSYHLRYIILKYIYRAKLGKVNIHLGVKFFSPWKLTMDDGSNIQWGSFLDCRGNIHIGKNVDITLGVRILSQDHDVRTSDYKTRSREVVICDNVVVGSYALILPGSVLNENCVLGAGSVFSGIIPIGDVFIGNPATFHSKRNVNEVLYTCDYKRPFH